MIEKNNRLIPFLKLLTNHNDYMKSEDICKQLTISPRTLRDDIVRFNELFLPHGLHIEAKHGTGYRIIIDEEERYHAYVANLLKEEEQAQRLLPVYPEDRINYLIKRLLNETSYCKLEDIADEMYISRSTIQNDMKEVRERLRFFHLELSSKPAYGIRVEGNEMHKRSCISQYFFHTDTMDSLFTKRNEMSEEQEIIRDILFETLDTMEFRLSDIGFQNLIIHISIALQRIHSGQQEDTSHYQDIFETYEYKVASTLVEALNRRFCITLPVIETCYITIHLMGKKTLQHHREYAITQEIEELLTHIFDEIKRSFHFDFSQDFELYTVLALHFQPMLNRLRYGLSMQNPLLEDIKKENHQAFEMSVLSASIIDEYFHFSMSESEMGYLALHYALAIERAQHAQLKKKNILVVCASGAGSSQILLYKIRQRFQQQLQKATVIEMYKLSTIDQSAYDLILTTVPIPFPTQIPVLQVQYFLDGKDEQALQEVLHHHAQDTIMTSFFRQTCFFSDIDAKTKEEVIEEMAQRSQNHYDIPKEFLASTLERERLSPTEFGNNIALPHPMKAMCNETFVAVAILKKPIRWTNQMVRFVFLMCVEKQSTQSLHLFHECISSFVCNEKLLQEFEKQPTYAFLCDAMNAICSKQSLTQDPDDIFR